MLSLLLLLLLCLPFARALKTQGKTRRKSGEEKGDAGFAPQTDERRENGLKWFTDVIKVTFLIWQRICWRNGTSRMLWSKFKCRWQSGNPSLA